MKLKESLIIALFISSAIGFGAFWSFNRQEESRIAEVHMNEEQSEQVIKIAKELIEKSHSRQALAFLRQNESILLENPSLSNSWIHLKLQAAQDLKDPEVLQNIYKQFPD